MGDLMSVYFQVEDSFAGGSYPHVSFILEHAGNLDIFSRHLVVEVEVVGLFIVTVDFILFSDEQAVFIIDAVNVTLKESRKALCSQIELGNAFGTEQIDFTVLIACHAQHGIAEKAVRVVFAQFIGLYIITVVAVQTFTRTNPQDTVLVNVQAVDAKLR